MIEQGKGVSMVIYSNIKRFGSGAQVESQSGQRLVNAIRMEE
jgi:hypothetical protein